MQELIASADITIRLLQTGEQYSYKENEVINADGLLADRLIRQSKGIIKYVEVKEMENSQKINIEDMKKELNSKTFTEILENEEYRKLVGEEFLKSQPSKKQLISTIIENVGKQDGNKL